MFFDARNGYGLQFTKYDGQNNSIVYKDTKEDIIKLADIIINSLIGDSLLEHINTMQANSYSQEENGELKIAKAFENKFEIPSYFINLILEKYNMKVVGW